MCHNIIEILTYAFMAITKKENYQVAALWPKDFEELNIKMDSHTLVLISDLVTITLEDYEKFFSKI